MSARFRLLLILPVVVFLLIIFVYPIIGLLLRSVTVPELGWQNFQWALSNPTVLSVIYRTLWVATVTTLICLILGYPYAYIMAMSTPKVRALLTFLVLIPFWTSLMVRTFAWVIIFQKNGVLNYFLNGLGFESVRLLNTTAAVLIGMCQILMPFAVMPLYGTLSKMDRNLLKAGEILGANGLRRFFTLTLPLSLPGILASGLIVFLLSLGFYVTPAVLGSPRQELISNAIYTQIDDLFNWGHASTLAVILLLLVAAVLAIASIVIFKLPGGKRVKEGVLNAR